MADKNTRTEDAAGASGEQPTKSQKKTAQEDARTARAQSTSAKTRDAKTTVARPAIWLAGVGVAALTFMGGFALGHATGDSDSRPEGRFGTPGQFPQSGDMDGNFPQRGGNFDPGSRSDSDSDTDNNTNTDQSSV